jgi:hypothetical protein
LDQVCYLALLLRGWGVAWCILSGGALGIFCSWDKIWGVYILGVEEPVWIWGIDRCARLWSWNWPLTFIHFRG